MEEKEKILSGFIYKCNISLNDISCIPYERLLFESLQDVAAVVGSLYQGYDTCDRDREKILLCLSARKLQLAFFQAGTRTCDLFVMVESGEEQLIRNLYEQQKLDGLDPKSVQDTFLDMTLEACSACNGIVSADELAQTFAHCLEDFIAIASAYATVEEVEGWFYG